MGFGRFKGGQHFKKLDVKHVKYSKPIKETTATDEQLAELKLLGYSFQKYSISQNKANSLIKKIKEVLDRKKEG